MGCCKGEKPIGINKLKSILAGWSNVLWSNETIRAVAHERAAVCAVCDKNKKNWCTDCGCWIPAKARSPDEVCEHWNNIDKKL